MQKKIVLFVLIALAISAVSVSVYFFKPNESNVNPAENPAPENGEQPQSELETDDFSIDLPAGWRKTAPAAGASAMAVNADENINDPAAQKINFQSYFAVSYDTLQGGNMDEYLQTLKNSLQQAIPSVVFTKEQDMTVNGKSAHVMEMELTQQGVNFKVLMVVVKGEGDDFWVISFNTTKSSWDGYEETFYGTANSFSLKK